MAMHEENLLSSWLREDARDKKESEIEVHREAKKEVNKKKEAGWAKEENGTVVFKKEGV